MSVFEPRQHLRGIVASLHTPFDAVGGLDEESLARLVRHCAGAGCSGVLAGAVAGEVGALSPRERPRLLEVVSAAAPEGGSQGIGQARPMRLTTTLRSETPITPSPSTSAQGGSKGEGLR